MANMIASHVSDLSLIDPLSKISATVAVQEIEDIASDGDSETPTPSTTLVDDCFSSFTSCPVEESLCSWRSGRIIDVFQDVVLKYPGRTALTSPCGTIDYQTLNVRANKLTWHLISIGVEPGCIVGVRLPRSVDAVVGIVAIWKAGAVYVPIDCSLPEDRVKTIVEDSHVEYLLTYKSILATRPFPQVPVTMVLLDCQDSISTIAQLASVNPSTMCTSQDLAYILYTSGSTGKPKGVTISHGGLLNMTEEIFLSKENIDTDRVIAFSSLCFDASIREISSTITIGATLYLPDPEEVLPGNLIEVLGRQRITHISMTPSALRNCELAELPHLRLLAVVGEAADLPLMKKWGTNRIILNAYGPTEASVCSSKRAYFPGDIEDESQPVSIGHPTLNTKIYILDRGQSLEPVRHGEIGEIYIGGPGVSSQGYLNRPELNSRVFIKNPFHPGLMFKSGDLGRFLPNGEIQCLGRIDHQVKLNGQRVECEDIERMLRSDKRVKDAVIDLRGPLEQRYLAAFIIRSPEGSLWEKAKLMESLRSYLGTQFPSYSLPNTFTFVDTWPTNAANKVVKTLLPDPLTHSRPEKLEISGTLSAVEEKVAEIFVETLRLPKNLAIQPSTSYFDLGGTSLTVQLLLKSVNQHFDSDIRVGAFYSCGKTVGGVANLVESKEVRHDCSLGRDFSSLVVLPHDIQPCQISPARLEPGTTKCVFLTGGTGFLGAHIMSEILESSTDKVFCLVRARNKMDAFRRIEECLASWNVWKESYRERVQAIPGDISKSFLGMDPLEFEALARECSVVWHCAAAVNFVAPYETLESTNVIGTVEVLRFASTFALKEVKYVSTLATFSGAGTDLSVALEESTRQWSKGLNTGYSQSKWVAEQMTLEYHQRGGNVTILRPGRILGSTHYHISPEEELTCRVLRCFAEIGVAPDVDWAFGFLPVDTVARLSYQLANKSCNGIFHVINPEKLTLPQVIAIMGECGKPVRKIPFLDWKTQISASHHLQPLLSLFLDPIDPSGATSFEFLLPNPCFGHDVFSCERSQRMVLDPESWKTPGYRELLRSFFGSGTDVC